MQKRNIQAKGRSMERGERKPQEERQKKAVAVGCLSAFIVGMFLLAVLSLMLSFGKIPIWAIKGLGLMLGCILACTAAFFCARYSKKNGFFLGMLCAGILFTILLLCSFGIGETPGMWSLVKLFSMLICGCIFGSVGVNVGLKKRSI